jgi:hypothetical protein
MFGQALASIGKKFNPGPILTEYFKDLEIPDYEKVIEDITEQDMLRSNMMAQMSNPQPQQGEQEEAEEPEETGKGEKKVANGGIGRRENRMLNRNMSMPMTGTLQTPAGQVLSAPGDQQASTNAIRSSTTENK